MNALSGFNARPRHIIDPVLRRIFRSKGESVDLVRFLIVMIENQQVSKKESASVGI